MIKPDIPLNEQERLKALEEYMVLDTMPESDFDDLTKLASEICQSPISLVSLIDKERQWFKSHYGIGSTETPREHAFCAHAINQPDELFIVNDSRKDERFHDNPLVTGSTKVVFYMGIPLVNPAGYSLGAFCVVDHKPRELSENPKKALRILGNQVVKLLELRKGNILLNKSFKDLTNAHEQIIDSISSAKIIQSALLPKPDLEIKGSFQMFVLYLPKNIVSGDFYWVYEKGDLIYTVVADCTGHGVSGALLTMLGISYLNEIIKESGNNDPALILDRIDQKIKENSDYGNAQENLNRDGMDIGIAIYNKNKKELTFSGAAITLYCCNGNTIENIPGIKRKIGYTIGADKQFSNTFFKVSQDHTFYLFSDGYQDQFKDDSKEKFYKSRLLSLISEIKHLSMQAQKETLREKLNAWKGTRAQTDDILVVGWKY